MFMGDPARDGEGTPLRTADPLDEEVSIVIEDLPALTEALGDYAQRLVHVLYHAAKCNRQVHVKTI